MIIWSGHGILIPVFGVAGFVFGLLAGTRFHGGLGLVFGALCGAGMVWLYALTLGKPVERVLHDPESGKPVRLTRSHTFFFIPAFAWAILSSLGAVGIAGIGITAMVSGEGAPAEQAPGAAEFKAANDLIRSASHGAYHGNTETAASMAESYAALVAAFRDGLIEESRPSRVSLSGGDFLTYCHHSEEGLVFLVRVPSLRRFTAEAKEVMADAAWFAANVVASRLDPAPENLAVGVRGAALYDEILVGSPGADFDESPRDGVRSTYKSQETSVFYPFFASPAVKFEAVDPGLRDAADPALDAASGEGTGDAS